MAATIWFHLSRTQAILRNVQVSPRSQTLVAQAQRVSISLAEQMASASKTMLTLESLVLATDTFAPLFDLHPAKHTQ
jgi:hypothetical protein